MLAEELTKLSNYTKRDVLNLFSWLAGQIQNRVNFWAGQKQKSCGIKKIVYVAEVFILDLFIKSLLLTYKKNSSIKNFAPLWLANQWMFFLQVIIIHSLFVQMSNKVYTVEAGILFVCFSSRKHSHQKDPEEILSSEK